MWFAAHAAGLQLRPPSRKKHKAAAAMTSLRIVHELRFSLICLLGSMVLRCKS